MLKKFKKTFDQKGYFIIKNIFSKNFIESLLLEIDVVKDANYYYDNKNKLRRIEKLYDKGEERLNKELNLEKILRTIRNIKIILKL